MRRTLLAAGTLAATLATGLAAPAGAADQWVHISADGPSIGTFTLSQALALDFPNAVADTKSAYAVLVVSDAKGIVAVGGKIPDAAQHRYASVVPAGRVTFRLMTAGKTTLKIPSRTVKKRTTFRLSTRLPGTFAAVRSVTPVAPNAVHHAIPLTVRVPSVIWHGFYADTTTGYMPTGMCVQPDETTPCEVWPFQGGGSYWYLASAEREAGRHFAKVTSTTPGAYGATRVHWVLMIPMG